MSVLIGLGIVYALWVFYLAVMSLLRAYKAHSIGPVALVPGYFTLFIGAILDVAVNVLFASVLFLELPQEFLLTSRLKRHIRRGQGWRKNLASWMCKHLLNPFDPSGDHCD